MVLQTLQSVQVFLKQCGGFVGYIRKFFIPLIADPTSSWQNLLIGARANCVKAWQQICL